MALVLHIPFSVSQSTHLLAFAHGKNFHSLELIEFYTRFVRMWEVGLKDTLKPQGFVEKKQKRLKNKQIFYNTCYNLMSG